MPYKAHLYTSDSSESFIGTVKAIHGGSRMDDDGECQVIVTHIRLPASFKASRLTLRRSLADYFRHTCHCEHDCCGHFNGGVSRLIFKNKRNIVAIQRYNMNI